MKNRSLLTLLAFALLSLAAAGYALWQSNQSQQTLTTDRTLFPDLTQQAGDVARIEIIGDSQTVLMIRENKSWILPQKDRAPADASRVAQLIASLSHMTLVEEKTANPARYADLKLAPPGKDAGDGTEVKLIDAHGTVLADAIIGRIAPTLGRVGGGFYARRTDQPPSWLIEGTIDAPTNIMDWASPKISNHLKPATADNRK